MALVNNPGIPGGLVDPSASGSNRYRVQSAATTNGAVIKPLGGRVVGGLLSNTSVATKFLKLYDQVTVPNPAVDVPAFIIAIAPNTQIYPAWEPGIEFKYGIAVTITGAAGDTDATAVAANDVTGFLEYV